MHRSICSLLLVAIALLFGACSAGIPGVAATSAGPTATPLLGDAPGEGPTPTAGLPCSGGRWGAITAFIGPNIPLPPLTVTGPDEYTPSGSWAGHFVQLCTGGNLESVSAFVQQHMPPEGWTLGSPPADCICNGLPVWSRANDGRLVQFDSHPTLFNGAVRWSVTIFTHN